jgi:hypothetical protein
MDDILVVTEREELIKLHEGFIKEFHMITMVIDNKKLYLEMQIKVTNEDMLVDMHYYLDKVLSEHDNLQVVAGPGTKESFMVNEASPVLNNKRGRSFTPVS